MTGAAPTKPDAGLRSSERDVGVRPSERDVGVRPSERILDATLRCIARWGLTKTTVDDIAREAGVGRATVYRLFPGGREAILEAVVAAEAARFFDRVETRVAQAASLSELLVAAIVEAGTILSDHAALQFLFAYEPEAILPLLAFQHMDGVLAAIAGSAGRYFAPWLGDAEAAARAAEWVARIVFSYLVAPSTEIDVTDPASVRHLVETYVLPGLVPATPGEGFHA